MSVIDLQEERNRRDGPDAERIRIDEEGRKLYTFLADYKMDGSTYTASIWAYDWEDAERRLTAIRFSGHIVGMLHAVVPA